MKFYPYINGGGGGKGFSHAEGGGGGTKCFGVVLTQELEVLAILNGGVKCSHPLKKKLGGRKRFYPVLRWEGGQKVSELRFSHFVTPPAVINYPSPLNGYRKTGLRQIKWPRKAYPTFCAISWWRSPFNVNIPHL